MHAAPRQLKQRGTKTTTNSQRQRKSQKLRDGVSRQEELTRFGDVLGFRSPGTEVVSKEVVAKVTDYFPYAVDSSSKGVLTYTYDLAQNLAFPGSGVGASVRSHVKRVKVYAYPRSVNAANAENLYTALTAVPLRLVTATSDRTIVAHQQSHTVMPTFTPSWKKVADIDYQKLMKDTEGIAVFAGQSGMVLFQLAVVNPDNAVVEVGTEYQFKVEIILNQPIPLQSRIKNSVQYLDNYGSVPAEPVKFDDSPVFTQILGLSNVA